MRATGFMTNRTRQLSSISALDKSRLRIPSSIDPHDTLNLMVDQETLQGKKQKGRLPNKAQVDGHDNALIQLKMKNNFLNKEERVFDKRKRSQAVKASGGLLDENTESIPKGSPRATKLAH